MTTRRYIATLTVLLSWGDPNPGFPAGERFVGFTKGFGLVFFPSLLW